jgi:hypothetical protein
MARPGNDQLAHFDPVYFGSGRDGHSFTGAYVETLTGTTRYGPQPVHLFDDGGERKRMLWAFHVGLKMAWNDLKPQPGQRLTITRSERPLPIGDGKQQYEYAVRVG